MLGPSSASSGQENRLQKDPLPSVTGLSGSAVWHSSCQADLRGDRAQESQDKPAVKRRGIQSKIYLHRVTTKKRHICLLEITTWLVKEMIVCVF